MIQFLLRQEIRNDVTMDICVAIVSPLIPVCQPIMIDSQLVYNRCPRHRKTPCIYGLPNGIVLPLLRQEICNDVTMDICEALASPLIPVCQPIMIDSHMVLNCPPGIDKTTNTKGQTKTDDPVFITTRDP